MLLRSNKVWCLAGCFKNILQPLPWIIYCHLQPWWCGYGLFLANKVRLLQSWCSIGWYGIAMGYWFIYFLYGFTWVLSSLPDDEITELRSTTSDGFFGSRKIHPASSAFGATFFVTAQLLRAQGAAEEQNFISILHGHESCRGWNMLRLKDRGFWRCQTNSTMGEIDPDMGNQIHPLFWS